MLDSASQDLHTSTLLFIGHAGWLGWSANLSPAATLFAQLYKAAGSPKTLRGLATSEFPLLQQIFISFQTFLDVANYNALSTSTPDPITSGDSNYDELLYINVSLSYCTVTVK